MRAAKAPVFAPPLPRDSVLASRARPPRRPAPIGARPDRRAHVPRRLRTAASGSRDASADAGHPLAPPQLPFAADRPERARAPLEMLIALLEPELPCSSRSPSGSNERAVRGPVQAARNSPRRDMLSGVAIGAAIRRGSVEWAGPTISQEGRGATRVFPSGTVGQATRPPVDGIGGPRLPSVFTARRLAAGQEAGRQPARLSPFEPSPADLRS